MSSNYHSIFEATYGIKDVILEVNRSQTSREKSFSSAQDNYDAMDPNYQDVDIEQAEIEAAEKAMEYVEHEAKTEGYDNLDQYAMEYYNLQHTVDNENNPYSPGEQLIDQFTENIKDDIISGS
jgi:septation ring formation regulator EzrA